MMYISLGLLLLYFVSVYGVINKCYIGGINESNCDEINKESVLQLYISSYESKSRGINESNCGEINKANNGSKSCNFLSRITGCKKHEVDTSENTELDLPYIYYRHNDDVSTLFEYVGIDKDEDRKGCSPISLLDLYVMENENNLGEEWNKVQNYGTDIHKLKFHNKLVYMFYHNGESLFTNEDIMIFIKSSYETASMYYLANLQSHAYNVIQDVEYFFPVKTKNEITDIYIDSKELTIWNLLFYTLKLKVMESTNAQNIQGNTFEIDYLIVVKDQIKITKKILEDKLKKMPNVIIKKYPCPYILMYQSYLLDKDMDNDEKKNITNILKEELFDCNVFHLDVNLYSMYIYLTRTIIELDSCTISNDNAFSNLMLALKRPVLCIEDRLLNYKATLLMMDLYKNCIENNDQYKNLCAGIKYHRIYNIKTKNILDKITQLITYDTKTKNIESNFIKHHKINEDFVHMIVTMAIDMDSNSELYKKKLENVKLTIVILEGYVTSYNTLERIENMSNTTINELNIAYKWLVELNAVLCYGSYDEFQTSYEKYMSKIIEIKQTNRLDNYDSHIDYLVTKNTCKDVPKILSSKNYYKIGGWIFAVHKEKTTFTKETIKLCTKEYSDLISLTNPFINYTDIYIQLSRYYFETDFSTASMYIQKALRMPVITPVDRYINLEAHELYSMYFMIHNSKVSKEKKKLKKK